MIFPSAVIFVRILLPYLLGIYVAHIFLGENLIAVSLTCVVVLFILLWLGNLHYLRLYKNKIKNHAGVLITIFWFLFGTSHTLFATTIFQSDYFDKLKPRQLKGWICNEPQQSDGIWRFELAVIQGYLKNTSFPAKGKLTVALKDAQLSFHYGDVMIINHGYTPVEEPYNPSEFNYREWLAAKHIHHQIFVNKNDYVRLATQSGSAIIAYAISLRKKQVAIYRKLIVNDEAFAVASTLVLGYRADLSKETLNSYSKTGTIHALSVSGMHVGIIYIFLNWILYFMDSRRFLKLIKLTFICILIWYYSLLTGFSPSVLRSAVMLTVYIAAKAFHKDSNSYNILAFTAFVLLIYDPLLLWDVGFQLSFLAVFGLIYLQPLIYNWFDFNNRWIDKLWSAVALSLAAQITTFPLSIYYFHQFPVYFIFSNLFILLPLTLMMYLGIGILLLKAYFLAPVFEWIINFSNAGLKWISSLPYSGITGIWITSWQLIILIIWLGTFIVALAYYRKKLLFLSLSLFLLLQIMLTVGKFELLHQKKILCFSLNKNYAIAFIDAKNVMLVTDLDLSTKGLDFFIRPELDRLGLTKINIIKWEKDTTIGSFLKQRHQIMFHGYRILLMDSCLNNRAIRGLPKFNAVWMHQNPHMDLFDLRQQLVYSTLLMDATNSKSFLNKNTSIANKINLTSHILKKNKAYLIDLNN